MRGNRSPSKTYAGAPLISIIVPSFNQAEFLEQTLTSILSQPYPHKEVLVVDGGSTDGSVEIIRRYEAQLAWWVSERDRGQSDAINKGVAHACGDIIAWLNSDDMYLPWTLTVVADAFMRNPGAAAVYGDYYVLRPDGKMVLKKKIAFDWEICLRAYMMSPQPSTFIARWAWDHAGGVDINLHYCMDYDLILKVGRLGPVVQVKEPLSVFRLHKGSKTMEARGQFRAENRLVRERALGRPLTPVDNVLERFYLAKAVWRFLWERGVLVLRRGK